MQRDSLKGVMGQMDYGTLVPILVALLAILFFLRWTPDVRWWVDTVMEAIDNFRGGPPTPMHPSPAGDDALLRARSKKAKR
jgi:hypothetical protein